MLPYEFPRFRFDSEKVMFPTLGNLFLSCKQEVEGCSEECLFYYVKKDNEEVEKKRGRHMDPNTGE